MKKLFLSALVILFYYSSVLAQSGILKKSYSMLDNTSEFESIGIVGVSYFSFKGGENWGLHCGYLKHNNLGFEGNWRSNWKEEYMSMNYDFEPNYSFQLLDQDDTHIYISAAFGPSIRIQKTPKYNSLGQAKKSQDTNIYIDAVFTPTLSVNYKRLLLSIGAMYWAPQWKFSEDEGGAWGFVGTVGIGL